MNLREELSAVVPELKIVTRRVIDVESSVVYKAWSEANHLHRWWGPEGFTNQFQEYDFSEGGQWIFDMVGPTGIVYPNHSEFRYIEEGSCIIWEHISQPKFMGMVTFEQLEDIGTRVVYTMIFTSVEETARLKQFIQEKNEENFDRLEKEIGRMK